MQRLAQHTIPLNLRIRHSIPQENKSWHGRRSIYRYKMSVWGTRTCTRPYTIRARMPLLKLAN